MAEIVETSLGVDFLPDFCYTLFTLFLRTERRESCDLQSRNLLHVVVTRKRCTVDCFRLHAFDHLVRLHGFRSSLVLHRDPRRPFFKFLSEFKEAFVQRMILGESGNKGQFHILVSSSSSLAPATSHQRRTCYGGYCNGKLCLHEALPCSLSPQK